MPDDSSGILIRRFPEHFWGLSRRGHIPNSLRLLARLRSCRLCRESRGLYFGSVACQFERGCIGVKPTGAYGNRTRRDAFRTWEP
jgi:hypothetical protein